MVPRQQLAIVHAWLGGCVHLALLGICKRTAEQPWSEQQAGSLLLSNAVCFAAAIQLLADELWSICQPGSGSGSSMQGASEFSSMLILGPPARGAPSGTQNLNCVHDQSHIWAVTCLTISICPLSPVQPACHDRTIGGVTDAAECIATVRLLCLMQATPHYCVPSLPSWLILTGAACLACFREHMYKEA